MATVIKRCFYPLKQRSFLFEINNHCIALIEKLPRVRVYYVESHVFIRYRYVDDVVCKLLVVSGFEITVFFVNFKRSCFKIQKINNEYYSGRALNTCLRGL